MPRAGDLRDRFRFEPTAAGRVVGGLDKPGDYTAEGSYTCWCAVTYLKGTEAVQAARLQGQQPVVLVIRVCPEAKAIDTTWRAVDTADETRVYQITSTALSADRAFVEVLANRKAGER